MDFLPCTLRQQGWKMRAQTFCVLVGNKAVSRAFGYHHFRDPPLELRRELITRLGQCCELKARTGVEV